MRHIKVRERVDHGLSVVQDVDEAQAESCPAEFDECLSRYVGYRVLERAVRTGYK